MVAFAFLVCVPVAVQEASEDLRFDFGLGGFVEFLGVAGGGFVGAGIQRRPGAIGIDVRDENDVLAVGRPEFAVGFGGDAGEAVGSSDRACGTVKIRDPDLLA